MNCRHRVNVDSGMKAFPEENPHFPQRGHCGASPTTCHSMGPSPVAPTSTTTAVTRTCQEGALNPYFPSWHGTQGRHLHSCGDAGLRGRGRGGDGPCPPRAARCRACSVHLGAWAKGTSGTALGWATRPLLTHLQPWALRLSWGLQLADRNPGLREVGCLGQWHKTGKHQWWG